MERHAARVPQLVRLRQAKDLIDRSFGEPLDVRALASARSVRR